MISFSFILYHINNLDFILNHIVLFMSLFCYKKFGIYVSLSYYIMVYHTVKLNYILLC